MPRPRFAPGSTAVFHIKSRSGKKKLAHYLGSRLGVIDSWAADLIAGGHVQVNGQAAMPSDHINLSAGPHIIEVRFPEAWPKHMAGTEMPLVILYEDADLVVLDKPPGVVVHPARGHLDNQTLQNGVRHRYRHLLGRPGISIGPPHRLDKDTSGVIIFALTRAAYIGLVEQFANRQPGKRYLALLDGVADFGTTVCEAPIGNDPEHKGRGKVVPAEQGGREAKTTFHILETGAGWSLAETAPHTGRPHQIRIHAASLGFPLAGDREYNPNPERLPMRRQALHAASLEFAHPMSGKPILVESPLPEDMRLCLEWLRREKA